MSFETKENLFFRCLLFKVYLTLLIVENIFNLLEQNHINPKTDENGNEDWSEI